ncbi:hypothetical protein [Acidisoma sp. 7E03]
MSDTSAEGQAAGATTAGRMATQETVLLENMFAPELFATLASSFSLSAGSVTIKLVSTRWDNSVEPAVQKAVVVGRITMPLQGAQTLAAGLQNFLEQHGLQYVPLNRPRTRASDAIVSSPNTVQS